MNVARNDQRPRTGLFNGQLLGLVFSRALSSACLDKVAAPAMIVALQALAPCSKYYYRRR